MDLSSRISPAKAAQESPLGGQLLFVLSQLQHQFHIRTQAVLTEVDLDVRQYCALAFIADGHTPTQHDLAHILHLDPSQVVTLTKGLEARQLLKRKTAEQDRRAKALAITAEGRTLYEEAEGLVSEVEASLTPALSRRDRNALRAILHRIVPFS